MTEDTPIKNAYKATYNFERLNEWRLPKTEGGDKGITAILYKTDTSKGIKLRSYNTNKEGKVFDEDRVNITTKHNLKLLIELLQELEDDLDH